MGRTPLTLFALLLIGVLTVACGARRPSPTATPTGEPHIELVSISPDPPKVGLLEVAVRVLGPDGRPMDEQIVQVRIVPEMVGMPTHTVEEIFNAQGNGVYQGQADVSALGGTWRLKVIAELKDGQTVEQTFEIVAQY